MYLLVIFIQYTGKNSNITNNNIPYWGIFLNLSFFYLKSFVFLKFLILKNHLHFCLAIGTCICWFYQLSCMSSSRRWKYNYIRYNNRDPQALFVISSFYRCFLNAKKRSSSKYCNYRFKDSAYGWFFCRANSKRKKEFQKYKSKNQGGFFHFD